MGAILPCSGAGRTATHSSSITIAFKRYGLVWIKVSGTLLRISDEATLRQATLTLPVEIVGKQEPARKRAG